MIEARKISKHFGTRVILNELDLKVDDGMIVALLGPNGAGKTTLLRILSTLTAPSSGDVILNDASAFDDPIISRRHIGLMGHSTYTYDDLSPLENLRFYWDMNSLPRRNFNDVAKGLLDRLGLTHRMNDRVAIFSKGMRQRLAIARALISSPIILLLDEPYSSLDQKGAEVLTKILFEERSKGKSIMLVTHEISRLRELVDRADVLFGGKISQSFDASEINRPDFESRYRNAIEGGII